MEITQLLNDALSGVQSVMNVSRIIGEPMETETCTILPVTKMTLGFACGGGEWEGKSVKNKDLPYGGIGGGADIIPIGFLVLTKNSVQFVKTEETWEKSIEKVFKFFS